MAMMAYMTAKGQKAGAIKGSITQKGREDSVGVIAVSHQIISPRDPQSGLATGQRQHKALVVTKELDKSSPIFYNALCTNEGLSEVIIKFWTPQTKAGSAQGQEVQHYTIKLTNATVSAIDFTMANIKHPETQKLNEYEAISFNYQKIEWTWNDGGISAGDDWQSRN